MNFSKNQIVRIRWAFKRRDAAEKIINEARAKVPGKNKTHALRKLLGLCPECGAETPSGRHYCDECRMTMNARHRKSSNVS
jgi:hypothetical protein